MLREVPVDGYDATPCNGITDYCFYDPTGNVIAVVEAKRTCRNLREGEEQLRHYVTELNIRMFNDNLFKCPMVGRWAF